MRIDEIKNDSELQRVLWACYRYWQDEQLPPEEKVICYEWVIICFEKKFGAKFHQSRLRHLAELGFLEICDTSRGGRRRYYKIINPDRVGDLLRKWNLYRRRAWAHSE